MDNETTNPTHRMRIALSGALFALVGLFLAAAPAGAQEVTYNPAAPQGAFTDIVTDNYVAFIALGIAMVVVWVPVLLASRGLSGAKSILRGSRSR